MRILIAALSVVTGLFLGTGLSFTSAQSGIPNGVFVQDGNGGLWLVLDGKKVAIPIWTAPQEDIRALPRSDRWAVANEDGAIVAGDPPSWLPGDGLAARYGPISPLTTRSIVQEARGQEAVGTFLGQTVKATVTEMSILDSLPEKQDRNARLSQRYPRGKYVVVAVRLENIGKEAVCCVPKYRLRDSEGRIFSGETSRNDDLVNQAMGTVYLTLAYERDLQPNMPVSHILVYDVPTDARSFVLVPDR